MRVALGADHAGVALKDALKRELDALGMTYEDFGTEGPNSVDYPDFAATVARGVSEGRFDRGVLVCGSGIGMAITANKVAGIRAAAIGDTTAARLSREHNDLNVLALGARATPLPLAADILRTFLETPFAGGRHEGRVRKIHEHEAPGRR
jgi:ribose 5-phosphate isomerase B